MSKGGNNERKKSKEWSLWWTGGKRNDVFWRTNSGARATQRAKQGLTTANEYGDMICLDPIGEPLLRIVTIENKKGYNEDLDFLSLVDSRGSKQILKRFWNQICRDAERAAKAGWGENPILIIHRDRRKPLIAMRTDMASYFKLDGPLDMNFDTIWWGYSDKSEGVVFFPLEKFFEIANPEWFIEIYAQINKNQKLPNHKRRNL